MGRHRSTTKPGASLFEDLLRFKLGPADLNREKTVETSRAQQRTVYVWDAGFGACFTSLTRGRDKEGRGNLDALELASVRFGYRRWAVFFFVEFLCPPSPFSAVPQYYCGRRRILPHVT
jgi:hypothetical protein